MGDILLRPIEQLTDGFTMDMQEFLYDRMERVSAAKNRTDYRDKTNDACKLKARLRQNLEDQEMRKSLEELVEAMYALEDYTALFMYRQGFSEGVRFIVEALSAKL